MKTQHPKVFLIVGWLIIVILTLHGFLGFIPALTTTQAQQQDRVIIINADQPNVWTLEQAHYLLAQMHRRNLDLKAKSLDALDPNEISGLRFDVLRTLIELGVTYDDANRVSNSLLSRNKTSNAARRQELIARRQQLRDESLALTREIAKLQAEKAAATTQEEKDRLDEKIAAKTAVRAEVDKEVEFTDKELATLTDPSGDFKKTEADADFDPAKLPKSTFDEAFKKAAETMIERFNKEPSLNASLKLENFLQMQYEIIAKQLTLLRDEVGPGERLLFLELPQTVNVTHNEADKKWAQSWWRIDGYTRNVDEYAKTLPEDVGDAYRDQNQALILNQNNNKNTNNNKNENGNKNENSNGNDNEKKNDNQDKNRQSRARQRMSKNSAPQPTSMKIEQLLRVLSKADPKKRVSQNEGNTQYVNLESEERLTVPAWNGLDFGRTVLLSDRTVRAVELIPRQSSLNVNDMKLRVKSGALSAVANFLFGFGASLNVQRQREQFSQFVQQELYSSAFGKGSREFGWTFTAMPGTDRLQSGVRTTYAVVVVPEEATSLVLESNGCYFPRSAYQPNDFNDTLNARWKDKSRTSRNCGSSKAFLVPIPVGASGSNDFRVDGLTYRSVDKGERIVVSVYGYNFSSQTGVLVDGSPLTHAIGLAQPLFRDDSLTGAKTAEDVKGEKVHGRIERIDSEQIVFSFEMPKGYTGTPTITLVAPGKAIDLNILTDLYINGSLPAALSKPYNACPDRALVSTNGCRLVCWSGLMGNCLTVTKPMYNLDPDPPIKIHSLEVFRSADGRSLTAVVTGKGLNQAQYIYVNGVPVPLGAIITPSLIRADIPTPPDEMVQVVFTTGEQSFKSNPVPNPAHLKINNVTVISYEPASRNSNVMVLLVKLEGSGFSKWLDPSTGRVTPLSSSEAILRIENPAQVTPLVLTDRRTGFEARTIITRKRLQE